MNDQRPVFKTSRIAKLKGWLKKHWIAVTIISASILITAVFVFALSGIKEETFSIGTNTQRPKPAVRYFSELTGIEVGDEAATKQAVTAVMIENSPDSRPQSGLKRAGIVYETVAEGGITRFLAIYQHDKPELIGPVRSLRIYYLDWAAPYQASIAHVGGSYNALQEVGNGNYRDLDQSFNASAYWRSSDRYAPHNVYTSGKNLDDLNNSKGFNQSSFTSFKRADEKPAEEPTANTIFANFSSELFATSYAYDKESNSYLRSLAGAAHNDREEGQINPKSIVVLKVTTQSRGGADGYEDVVTNGSGQAYIFQNGSAQEVTWRKDGRTEPLRLIDQDGKDVSLVRGQTWVAAITERGSVSWQ